jgi:hypothetical protein
MVVEVALVGAAEGVGWVVGSGFGSGAEDTGVVVVGYAETEVVKVDDAEVVAEGAGWVVGSDVEDTGAVAVGYAETGVVVEVDADAVVVEDVGSVDADNGVVGHSAVPSVG